MRPFKRIAGLLLVLPAICWILVWVCVGMVLVLPTLVLFGTKRAKNLMAHDIGFEPLEFACRLIAS